MSDNEKKKKEHKSFGALFEAEMGKKPPKPTQKPKSQSPSRSSNYSQSQRSTSSQDWIIDQVKNIPDQADGDNRRARAPYNFIPLFLNYAKAKDYPQPDEGGISLDRYYTTDDKKRFTGWIDLNIETQTPLYIRDSLNQTEQTLKTQSEKKNQRYINSDFFSPGNTIRIPGSSLRGMTRNLVEILGFGKMRFVADQQLYYRGLADQSNLRDEYGKYMTPSYNTQGKEKALRYNASAGILRKKGRDYYILETDFTAIEEEEAKNKVSDWQNFNFYELPEAYLVVSGPMEDKAHWIVDLASDQSTRIDINQKDIESYIQDTNRKELPDQRSILNLIDLLQEKDEVPCFFVEWRDKKGNSRISFGHTPMFRLAYHNSIGEHIPSSVNDLDGEKEPDLAEAIFGNKSTFAGRVFFEDAFLLEENKDIFLDISVPKILSSPKPTTFQHYLVQDSYEKKQLNHYNTSNAAIRGYKWYWHQSGSHWKEDWSKTQLKVKIDKLKTLQQIGIPSKYLRKIKDGKLHLKVNILPQEAKKKLLENIELFDDIHTKIRPLKAGVEFKAKIRFENLSEVELGALLFALDLPQGCGPKIGMGKPLGLGSIKITPQVYLSDRKERYTNLWAEWNPGEIQSKKAEFIEDLKKNFEKEIIDQLKLNCESLWDTDRLTEFRNMIDFEKGQQLEAKGKTTYMNIEPDNEFSVRPVLPRPTDITDKNL